MQPRMQTLPQPPVFPQPPAYPQLPFPQLHPPLPSFTQSPMPCAGLQPSWNSSMSPSNYELVIMPPTVRKCYGCGDDDKYKTPPCNIIKHVDKRVTGKDSTTGQPITHAGLFKHILSSYSDPYNQKKSTFFWPSLPQV